MLTADLTDATLRQRNVVSAVGERGLSLRVNGKKDAVSWHAIDSVVAGIIEVGDGQMFVLALDIEIDNSSRTFLVCEIEPVWLTLTAALHEKMPGIEPFEIWGVRLAESPDVIELYRRLEQS